MKKMPLVLSVIAILLALFTMYKTQNASEQVYVDVNKLLEGYKRTKVVRAEFEVKAKKLNANVDSLMVGWQNELKTYEKERARMSKKELKLKQELLSNKQQQVNSYQQAVQKQLEEADKKSTQTVINDINDYVKDYGKKHNYAIVFGASGGGNIMYASKGADLTEIVLEGINKEFEGKK